MHTIPASQVLDRIQESGIIAIIRGNFPLERLHAIVNALYHGGLTVVELTLNSPVALQGIAALRDAVPESMLIGAGTVRTASDVELAINAGAQFLISPNFDPESVKYSGDAGVLHMPGVFTASEAQAAYAAGCPVVKLFPAGALGPSYLKALRAPLNDIGFVPTGGIDVETAADFLHAGALALGVGSSLVSGPDQDLQDVSDRAIRFATAVKEARQAE